MIDGSWEGNGAARLDSSDCVSAVWFQATEQASRHDDAFLDMNAAVDWNTR